MTETRAEQGYIVQDDYADPLQREFRMYNCKHAAISEAKNRLLRILEFEQRENEYSYFAETLDACLSVSIQQVRGGWHEDMATIQVATLYTGG
jgi:hypothetical protein